ncbi:MAG: hypothetical protein KDB03_23890, partial [Planctomycetales bacterium]|nr:hypothetical protein [Planctomycetales bacterium]
MDTASRVLLWLLMLAAVGVAGCGGCRKEEENLTREEIERRQREREQAIELQDPVTLPADVDRKILTVKPGHWHETKQVIKSNREDLQVVVTADVALGMDPVELPGTDITNEYTRRTALPKGQEKAIDLQCYMPQIGSTENDPNLLPSQTRSLSLRSRLLSWPLLTPLIPQRFIPCKKLNPNEFLLTVIGPEALGYEHLTTNNAVFWSIDGFVMGDQRIRSYDVSLIKPIDNKYAIPHSMLTMTAMAVLVWDDVNPDDLSSDQQQAIVDWIHWGGQLIVNGPSSWNRLQQSFLTPYLPISAATALELGQDNFGEISSTWATQDLSDAKSNGGLEITGSAISGISMQLAADGQWLPRSGQLVAEKQLGRGRVVVTAFPMRDPRITNWKYYGSFFSTGLLRRPPREIVQVEDGKSQKWFGPLRGLEYDPRLHSNFRILTRDLRLGTADNSSLAPNSNTSPELAINSSDKVEQEALLWNSNGAAWNAHSAIAMRVAEALRGAAGIEMPKRSTLLWLLGGYLVCLVPVNWLVFKIIGRLEWAWLAAPMLAIIGVVVVTKVARLDIGFARRGTEIAVLEIQGSHPRAHLTSYMALYTSLRTNYSIDLPEDGSAVLPLGSVDRTQRRTMSNVQTMRTNYGSTDGVRLEPMTVLSNTTELLHAEQMVDLPGGLEYHTEP